MSEYIPLNTLPFDFTEAGYSQPRIGDIAFEFGADLSISQLKVAINGMELERDALKQCETYVVGYESNTVQIFRHSCTYLGVRDLSAYIQVEQMSTSSSDLHGYLKQMAAGELDVNFLLRTFQQQQENFNNIIKGLWHTNFDLTVAIKSWHTEQTKDLPFRIKRGFSDELDVNFLLRTFQQQQEEFGNVLKGWSVSNVKDLFNIVKGSYKEELDIQAYIKSAILDQKDLAAIVYKIWQHDNKNINLILHGWQVANLQFITQVWHTEDLNIILRATYFNDVGAFLYAIQPVDIEAELRGWAIQDLSIYIARGDYDGDLPVYIYGVNSINLPIYLVGKLGIQVIKDLAGTMTNLSVEDLPISLNTISYSDLNAYLLSSRLTVDLNFKIYPKIVFVRHNINVSFLEHRDLVASINHTCVSSSFRELSFSMIAKHKHDLPCFIYGGDDSNIVDLQFFINSYDYIAQNTIPVEYINLAPSTKASVFLNRHPNVYSLNLINVYGGTLNKEAVDLTYSITGDMLYNDLGVRIHPYSNPHYDTSIVQKFVTLKLKNNIEDFRKYVELTFNSYINKYYYFSGNQRAYKAFRDDHWVVKVEGHQLLPVGSGFEKTKVHRKYIFNLKHYETIDAAIKDMIDRVTQLRNFDLGVSITPTGGVFKDLNAYVVPRDQNGITFHRKYYTNRTLAGTISVTRPQASDLFSYITPTSLDAESNLIGEIKGVDYENSTDGLVDLNFKGSGDTQPEADQVDFTFIFGEN